MTRDELIRSLVAERIDSGLSAAEVCKDHPDLLPAVESRWQRVMAVSRSLDALFPSSVGRATAQHPPHHRLTDAPPFPGYQGIEFLGRGGMGVVYRALHKALGRPVAIKMLLPNAYDTPDEIDALAREASAIAALGHPNIVQVFDVGTLDGRPFFTMELLEGGSLAQKTAGVPQHPSRAAELVELLALAVHFAHQRGVVHCDLKPGNVLFSADGVPKIADFGLARRIAGEPNAPPGQIGFGTPSYMAPEQALGGPGRNHPAVDVYALGAVLYDALTGRPPFRADSPTETCRQVIQREPAPPSRLNARVPRDLETICLACLRKDPARRYPSAVALAEDLGRFLRGEPISARPVGPAERAGKWLRRNPARAAAWLGAALCLLMVFSAALWAASQHAALTREVAADFAEVVRLGNASQWEAARNMLERAKTRIALGFATDALQRQANQFQAELDLVDRLAALRLQRATAREIGFDRRRWWDAYRDQFIDAGLLTSGDSPQAFAARVAASNVKAALIDAMDNWAICATDKGELQWLLIATRTADPDPAWRDRVRTVATWQSLDALIALARSARLEDQPVPLLLIVAGLLQERGSQEGPLLLRRIQAAHPSDFWAGFSLAESLDRTDPEAVAFYRAAVALRPHAVAAHVNLGLVLAEQGRVAEAVECLQRAVALDAHNPVAQANLAIWLLHQGRFGEAAEHARLARDLQPDSHLGHGVLGSALLRLGRPASAADSLRSAIALLPQGHPQHASYQRELDLCQRSLAGDQPGQPNPPGQPGQQNQPDPQP